MKNVLILLFSALIFTSCDNITGSGNIVTEKRNADSFTAVNVGGGFDVEIKKGTATSLTVEADDNIIKAVETEVRGGTLHISLKKFNVTNAHLKIYIIAPSIKDIDASAGATVTVKDGLTATNEINLEASSGSKITTAVDAPSIIAHSSSAGEIIVNGHTKNFNAESSSGASVKATDLLSENATANASSGASAHVNSSVSLNATASSGGSVHYKGGGIVVVNTSSGGSVNKD